MQPDVDAKFSFNQFRSLDAYSGSAGSRDFNKIELEKMLELISKSLCAVVEIIKVSDYFNNKKEFIKCKLNSFRLILNEGLSHLSDTSPPLPSADILIKNQFREKSSTSKVSPIH